MLTITRKIEWCSGHRVAGHETKCKHLHGHNYTGYFECTAPELDDIGRIIDFSVIKDVLKGWIDSHWDHRFLTYEQDPLLSYLLGVQADSISVVPFNPTAENMAIYLLDVANELLPEPIEATSVTVWETPNCYATARLN